MFFGTIEFFCRSICKRVDIVCIFENCSCWCIVIKIVLMTKESLLCMQNRTVVLQRKHWDKCYASLYSLVLFFSILTLCIIAKDTLNMNFQCTTSVWFVYNIFRVAFTLTAWKYDNKVQNSVACIIIFGYSASDRRVQGGDGGNCPPPPQSLYQIILDPMDNQEQAALIISWHINDL